MASGIFVEFDASQHAVLDLLGLGAILVLLLTRVPLLKLYRHGARIALLGCACYLAHLRPKIYTAKAVVQESNFLASHQLAGSKMVLSRDHVVQKR